MLKWKVQSCIYFMQFIIGSWYTTCIVWKHDGYFPFCGTFKFCHYCVHFIYSMSQMTLLY